ncbi:MAG: nicotinamide riboside transporter PnuC [Sphingomonadales bacterium]|nr:nicotinamide riboside transporter PnuC [Sphingomonadales bacterium]MDE2570432.1 nicotinamide riboside transporter PnuC [Sphingomonadales bacterium]
MNPLEAAAFVLGFANIILLVRRSIWNFPFGMAMVAVLAFVLYRARLYSEAGLQVFFFVVQGYGWWLWHRAGGEEHAVAVSWLSPRARIAWSAVTAALSLSLGAVMHALTDAAMPFADSAVTGASIAAQFLLSFRRVENWVLWVGIDVVSIGLFVIRGLTLTAVLYAGFLVISVLGLIEWSRAARRARA